MPLGTSSFNIETSNYDGANVHAQADYIMLAFEKGPTSHNVMLRAFSLSFTVATTGHK